MFSPCPSLAIHSFLKNKPSIYSNCYQQRWLALESPIRDRSAQLSLFSTCSRKQDMKGIKFRLCIKKKQTNQTQKNRRNSKGANEEKAQCVLPAEIWQNKPWGSGEQIMKTGRQLLKGKVHQPSGGRKGCSHGPINSSIAPLTPPSPRDCSCTVWATAAVLGLLSGNIYRHPTQQQEHLERPRVQITIFLLGNTTFQLRLLKCKRATRRFKEHPDCTTDLAAVSR